MYNFFFSMVIPEIDNKCINDTNTCLVSVYDDDKCMV